MEDNNSKLPEQGTDKKSDTDKRIGIAKGKIKAPADFDETDFDTEKLFEPEEDELLSKLDTGIDDFENERLTPHEKAMEEVMERYKNHVASLSGEKVKEERRENQMLTKPDAGWTDFQLEGTKSYGLSYVNDLPVEWMEQAIHGLETLQPFCVEGFMEPNRFLCVVSYWNCHIITEYDGKSPLSEGNVASEYAQVSMLDFCKMLCRDIEEYLDDWVNFFALDHYEADSERILEEKKIALEGKLSRLKNLVAEKEEHFGEHRFFQ